jgi:hypothetical protein
MTFTSRLEVGIPPGWTGRDALELVAPDRRVHLVVSSEPVPADTTVASYADRYGTLMASRFPRFEDDGSEHVTLFGGRAAVVRRFRWTPPDRSELAQRQAYCIDGGRGYVATVTMPAEQTSALATFVDRLLDTLTLRSHPRLQIETLPVGAEDPAGELEAPLGGAADDGDWAHARKAWLREALTP